MGIKTKSDSYEDDVLDWVFPTEESFERYLDIAKGDGDTVGLRTFCQEMGLDDFDEDFLIAKYLKESDSINDFLDFVPAKTPLLQEASAPLNLQKANALICYSPRHGITPSQAVLASSVSYLGDFQYSTKRLTACIQHLAWNSRSSLGIQ